MQYSLSPQQLPANPVAAFFRTTNLVFAVYDTRRGQCEGEEAEKLLSFFPTIAPLHVRTSIVGLAQAVTSFAGMLSQDGGAFKTMVGEQHKWVMFRCEPCIWLLAVVRKSWGGGTCTNAAFKSLLTSMYDVFVLLHGRINTLLEQDPTAFALRRVLQPLLDEVGSRLLRPEAAAAREPGGLAELLGNPLAPFCPGAVPLLSTSHATFLAVQCLVSQLLVAAFYGSRLVGGAVVLWGGLPVWSTLGVQDTAALVTLATRALVPAARAAQRSGSAGAGSAMAVAGGGIAGGGGSAAAAAGPGEIAFETLLSPLQWRAGGGIRPAPVAPAAPSLASMAAGLGLSFAGPSGAAAGGNAAATATAASGPGGGGGAAATMFGPSTPGGISLAGILGFGVGAAAAPTPSTSGVATPPLPVSSSAAAGPSSFSSTSGSAGAAAGGAAGAAAGVGSVLPPFLSSFLRPRLRPALYSSAPGGGLPLDSALPMTHVWLRGSHEWAQLLPYHRGQLLVLALLHDGPPPGLEVLAALAAVLGRAAGPAAAALAAEVPARSVWHEKGHRYCYTDLVLRVSRYSPLRKVLTLSTPALKHLAHLRSKMDDWVGGAAGGSGAGAGAGGAGGGSGRAGGEGSQAQQQQEQGDAPAAAASAAAGGAADQDAAGEGVCNVAAAALSGDCELVVRTGHDAWLMLRAAAGGRRLYAATEQSLAELTLTQGTEPTLAAAVASTDALCDRLFPGVFLQP